MEEERRREEESHQEERRQEERLRTELARAGDGPPGAEGVQPCVCTDPVNTASGEYFSTVTDLAFPGPAPDLSLTRTYSSSAARDRERSVFGQGWSFPLGTFLKGTEFGSPETVVHNGNGSETSFVANDRWPEGEGLVEYQSPPGVNASLEQANGELRYRVNGRESFWFTDAGVLDKIENIDGNRIYLEYSGGKLVEAQSSFGEYLKFEYNGAGLVNEVSDQAGQHVKYAYSPAGELEEVTNPEGNVTTYGYEEVGGVPLLTSVTDPNGHVTRNEYDAKGRVEKHTDADGTTTFSYTGEGEEGATETVVTKEDGEKTDYVYEDGVLQKETKAYGTLQAASWIYTYEESATPDSPTGVTHPNGKTTHYTYNGEGRVLTEIDPDGNETVYTYDEYGDVRTVKDPDGVTTTNEFEDGNLMSTSTPLGEGRTATTYYREYSHGEPDEMTDPEGHTWLYGYTEGRLVSETDPAGDRTTWGYNAAGEEEAETTPRGNLPGVYGGFTTRFEYNNEGLPVKISRPYEGGAEGVSITKDQYYADGALKKQTDPDGHETLYAYYPDGQLETTTRPDGKTITDHYNGDGQLESEENAAGKKTTYSYDLFGYLASEETPEGRVTTYRHDPEGRLLEEKTPEGQSTTYHYDPAGRLHEVEYSDGEPPVVYESYDGEGRPLQVNGPQGTTTYAYNDLGWLTSETNEAGETIAYEYNPDGHPKTITYPNGKKVTDAYNANGELESVEDWRQDKTTFGYSPDGLLETTTFPSGTGESDSTTYDTQDQPTGMTDLASASILGNETYQHDPAGLLSEEEGPGWGTPTPEGPIIAKTLPAIYVEMNSAQLNGRLEVLGANPSYHFQYGETDEYGQETEAASTNDGGPTPVSFRLRGLKPDTTYHFRLVATSAGETKYGEDETFTTKEEPLGPVTVRTEGAEVLDGWLPVTLTGTVDLGGTNPSYYFEYMEPAVYFGEREGEALRTPTVNIAQGAGEQRVSAVVEGLEPGEEYYFRLVGTSNGITKYGQWESFYDFALMNGSARLEGATLAPATSPPATSYHYTPLEQLDEITADTSSKYEYNPVGSPTTQAGTSGYEYNSDQQLTHAPANPTLGTPAASYTYNTDGQRTAATPAPGEPTEYGYTQAGSLATITRTASETAPAINQTNTYNPQGLLTGTTEGLTTTRFAWDTQTTIPTLLKAGDTDIIYGPDDLPIEQITTNGSTETPLYYHHDQQGSTRLLTNEAGEVVGTDTYGPYGNVTVKTGEQPVLGYDAQYTSPSTGLVYLRARWYDPSTAQFLTRDPLVGSTGEPYAYAQGDPLNQTDPTGTISIGGIIKTGLAIIGAGGADAACGATVEVPGLDAISCEVAADADEGAAGDIAGELDSTDASGDEAEGTGGEDGGSSCDRSTIGGPDEFDPASLSGLTAEEVEEQIPSDWERLPSKSGGGEVFRDPANPGRQIRIMPGYGAGIRPDPLTAGPYAVVSQNGVVAKVPLSGNLMIP